MRECSRRVRITSVCLLVAYVWAFGPIHVARAEGRMIVPAGTLVLVHPLDEITPKSYNAGDTVEFVVAQDVKVEDQVVIKQGARARGQVTESKKAGIAGMPAKIGIQLSSVEALDGSMIPIRASKLMEGDDRLVISVVLAVFVCLPLILLPGGNTQISTSTVFEAFTLGKAEVALK